MYTLYWSPGSASQAPHGVLEEAGVEYELRRVNLDAGGHQDVAYLKLNPNGPPLRGPGKGVSPVSGGPAADLAAVWGPEPPGNMVVSRPAAACEWH